MMGSLFLVDNISLFRMPCTFAITSDCVDEEGDGLNGGIGSIIAYLINTLSVAVAEGVSCRRGCLGGGGVGWFRCRVCQYTNICLLAKFRQVKSECES